MHGVDEDSKALSSVPNCEPSKGGQTPGTALIASRPCSLSRVLPLQMQVPHSEGDWQLRRTYLGWVQSFGRQVSKIKRQGVSVLGEGVFSHNTAMSRPHLS